jgi:hypothetical protein
MPAMPKTPSPTTRCHDFPGRRWIIIVLRALHLVAVIALGALLLGAPAHPAWPIGTVASAVLTTGFAMLILDVAADRRHLRTVAGLTALAKLALVGGLALSPAPWLFWIVVAISAIVSHAPASFRHAELY